jgi:hypothetical protein
MFHASPEIVSAKSRPIVERTARECLETSAELRQLLADTAPLSGQDVSLARPARQECADAAD